ncbi:MAG: hypothetical protein HY690_07900 [Chloroflexi bacterium]|nr:hypothetical protein [Chloroflexota bacterium]
MTGHEEPNEVEADFVAKFPPDAGHLAHELWRDLAHLHYNWKNYRALYGSSPETIELLNSTASTFFALLDGILFHDIVLAIARLQDPPRSVGRDNASLARLVALLERHVEPSLYTAWSDQLRAIQTYCEPLRTIRNRIVAHSDLEMALVYHDEPPQGLSRAWIEGALKQLRDLNGAIERHFRGSSTSHEHVISQFNAEALIFALKAACEHERCREREFAEKYGLRTSNT